MKRKKDRNLPGMRITFQPEMAEQIMLTGQRMGLTPSKTVQTAMMAGLRVLNDVANDREAKAEVAILEPSLPGPDEAATRLVEHYNAMRAPLVLTRANLYINRMAKPGDLVELLDFRVTQERIDMASKITFIDDDKTERVLKDRLDGDESAKAYC